MIMIITNARRMQVANAAHARVLSDHDLDTNPHTCYVNMTL
jgi:hypothetical protein